MPHALPNRAGPLAAARALLIAAALALAPAAARAQARPAAGASAAPTPPAPAAVEARLPALAGVPRARALARLADAYKLDAPAKAAAYGREALALLDAAPDSAALLALRVATLNELTWAYLTLGRLDSAQASAEAGQDLAERTGNQVGLARALSNLGAVAQRRGDPHGAVALFERALPLQRAERADSAVATSLSNLGYVYGTDLAEYDRALAYHLEALQIRERLGDRASLALTLNNLGIVYARLRQYDRALAYFERSLALRRALGARTRVAATLSNLGDAHLERGDLPAALAAHERSLAIRDSVGDRGAVSLAHRNLAAVRLAMGDVGRARVHAYAALRIAREVDDRGLLVRNLVTLAAVQRAGGRGAAAERAAQAALDSARAMRSRELARRALEELARAQEAQGRLAAALESRKRLQAVSDSIFDETTARRVTSLEARHAAERRDRELDRLRREEARRRAADERAVARRRLAATLAVLFAGLVAASYRTRVARGRLAEELSLTDALTGLRNRRYVQQTMDADVAASARRHRVAELRGLPPDDADLVFQLVDLDHFKRVNDEFGHAAGDRVLAEVAGVLRALARESDVVARWGGEEFLIVSRFVDRAKASVFAERIRHAVASHPVALDGGRTVRVTCSVGFAAFPFAPDQPLTWEQVTALADFGTYAAKRGGRDGWVGHAHAEGELPLDALQAPLATLDALVAAGRLRREGSAGPAGAAAAPPPARVA